MAAVLFAAGSPCVVRAEGPQPAPSKSECIDAYTTSQHLKKKGELAAARTRLLICSRDPCPVGLQADCNEWLSDVQRLQPSIVVVASDEGGRELTDVRVFVDNVLAASRLDGRALDVDPGDRALRFEATGFAPVTQRAVLREGQKAREVRVRFTASSSSSSSPSSSRSTEGKERGGSWMPWVSGGLAVAALGVFGVAGISGMSQRSDLLASCNHRCSDSDKESVDRKFLVADLALGVAIVAGAATAVLLFTASSSPTTARAP